MATVEFFYRFGDDNFANFTYCIICSLSRAFDDATF